MKSSLCHLLECATDPDTRERIRRWIGIHMVETTQMITVTRREVEHAGDSHESFMEMRREQAFRNMAKLIKKDGLAETIGTTYPNGTYEERIRVLVVKP